MSYSKFLLSFYPLNTTPIPKLQILTLFFHGYPPIMNQLANARCHIINQAEKICKFSRIFIVMIEKTITCISFHCQNSKVTNRQRRRKDSEKVPKVSIVYGSKLSGWELCTLHVTFCQFSWFIGCQNELSEGREKVPS